MIVDVVMIVAAVVVAVVAMGVFVEAVVVAWSE